MENAHASSSLRSVVERLSHSEERFRLLVESVQDYALFSSGSWTQLSVAPASSRPFIMP